MFGNRSIIDFMPMDTGRSGGPESLEREWNFRLLDDTGSKEPRLSLNWFYDFGAFSSTAEVEAEFTLTVVPVPAAVWLFGSALGLMGWLGRSRVGH